MPICVPQRRPWTSQPQVPVVVDPSFLADEVFVPSFGNLGLLRGSLLTVNSSVTQKLPSAGGIEWKHTGTNYTSGITATPRASSYESWLVVLGSGIGGGASGKLIGDTTNSLSLATNIPSLFQYSSQRCTGVSVSPFDPIFASFNGTTAILAQRNSWVTNTSYGAVIPGSNFIDCQYLSTVLMIRWDDKTPDRVLVEKLLSNPWSIFKPASRNIYFDMGAAGGGTTLTPSLVTNNQTFYGATVSTGAVSLAPSLLSNAQTFFNATVSQGGATQNLAPSLVNNAQTFYGAAVSTGSVSVAPTLVTNSQTFFIPLVSNGILIAPPYFENAQTFYSAAVSTGSVWLSPSLVTNTQTFYSATVGEPAVLTLTDADLAAIQALIPTTADLAAAVLAAMNAAPPSVNAQYLNGSRVYGTGTSSDKWRGTA